MKKDMQLIRKASSSMSNPNSSTSVPSSSVSYDNFGVDLYIVITDLFSNLMGYCDVSPFINTLGEIIYL